MNEQVIDFHVHPFAEPRYCMNFYDEIPNPAGMRARLEQAGITHICGSVLQKDSRPENFEDIRRLNREALHLADALDGFYTPGFHIHPGYVKESCEEIEFMHQNQVRLCGELVPYLHGWDDFSENALDEILSVAEKCGMILCYHTPFAYSMEIMIASHPGLTFVAAHPGDRDRVPEHIALMRKYDNYYLDLSGTGLFRLGVLKYLVREAGSERILFGSDYPICNPAMYVQAVRSEDITEYDRENIFFRNAQKLLQKK